MTPTQMIKARHKAKLSQKALAKAINEQILKPGKYKTIGQTAISEMENGRNTVQWYIRHFFQE